MIFEQLQAAGGDRNFSYLVGDEVSLEAVIIDPGYPARAELKALKKHRFLLKFVINTHDHADHTGGNAELAGLTGAEIVMHTSAHTIHDREIRDGDILNAGDISLRIIHTPGHTPDSICILAGKDLMTGDTLFVGKVGGTGFGLDAWEEYDSIHRKLLSLPPETRVWPGHDFGVRPSSTIGDEIRENPFILRDSFESFLELKQNWLEYKLEHGIK